MTMITGEKNINVARMLAVISAMTLEMRGLNRRGRSAFSIAASEGWTKSRTKNAKNLAMMVESIQKEYPAYVPGPTVTKWLDA